LNGDIPAEELDLLELAAGLMVPLQTARRKSRPCKQFNINAEGDLVDREEACLTVGRGIAPQYLRRTCAGL